MLSIDYCPDLFLYLEYYWKGWIKAKEDYLSHFKLIWTYVHGNPKNAWNMPTFVGGAPPRPIEVQRELARTAFNFISSIGVTSAGELTQAQAELLYAEQRTILMKMYTDRARLLHLYVALPDDQDPYAPKLEDLQNQPPIGGGDFGGFGGLDGLGATPTTQGPSLPGQYPFDIALWARASSPPTPDQLWEGQVELWIIRDVMKAIHDMNKVGQQVQVMNPNGEIVNEWACVLNSPIKRLLKLDPLPGYVGLHSVGGVLEPSQLRAIASAQATNIESFAPAPGTEFGTDPTTGNTGSTAKAPSVYATPPAELAPIDPTDKAPEHFGITPTGRVSNSVFDVSHSRVIIDIESSKLPEFIEQLRKVNFMTVVSVNLEDIDEYDLLRDGGYVYGGGDVVRAELIVESLFFRNWTEKFMPKIVKQKLLILPPEDPGFGAFDPTGGAVPPSTF